MRTQNPPGYGKLIRSKMQVWIMSRRQRLNCALRCLLAVVGLIVSRGSFSRPHETTLGPSNPIGLCSSSRMNTACGGKTPRAKTPEQAAMLAQDGLHPQGHLKRLQFVINGKELGHHHQWCSSSFFCSITIDRSNTNPKTKRVIVQSRVETARKQASARV